MRLRLTTKYTFFTSIVLLGIMTTFAYFSIKTLEKICLSDALREVDNLSETIIRTTHYQMLEDDRKRVYQMMEEVGSQEGIVRIRLFNKEGMVTFSTEKSEIGTLVDDQAEGCNGCHLGETTLTNAPAVNRSRIFVNGEGKTVLGVHREIRNRESCSTAQCHFHPADAPFLGIMDVHVSLEGMKKKLSSYRNDMIFITVLMLFILAVCLAMLTGNLVNEPVNKLLEHTRKLARGEWDSSIGDSRSDELGELSRSFNDLTSKLKNAREELEEWGRNLEVKVEERTREIRQIQAQLIRSEKLASLGELVAGIAHEINNPLTGILVFASLLRNDPKFDPALARDMDVIIQESGRCARIVKGLLEFSREKPPRKTGADLNGIMEKALALIEHQALFQSVTISRDYENNLPHVAVDVNQIEQVFINILLNAGQAINGEGKMVIRSGFAPGGDFISMMISDDGCGIEPENLAKIFDPFFSTKDSKGTGLGLSVSYGIIENHGGKIDVQSTPGEGTVFTVLIPLLSKDDALAGAEEQGGTSGAED